MLGLGVGLADRHAEGVTAVERRVGEIQLAARIEALVEPAGEFVTGAVPEAHQVEGGATASSKSSEASTQEANSCARAICRRM